MRNASVVVRQNFSRGPKWGGSGRVGVNTIIDSVQQEDPNRASPVRVERPYIKDRLYVIDFTGGWSFGEPQSFVSSCFSSSRSQLLMSESFRPLRSISLL
jgi:hypothetical protein